jgi:hypothetical protein
VYRALNGRDWAQFNDNLPPVSANVGNALTTGNCITMLSNLVFVAFGNTIYYFDSTPPPITSRPPVARSQTLNTWLNTATNITLTGTDADGDALNFTITQFPAKGTLSGTPPDLTYTPSNNFTGPDAFLFVVDDGVRTSSPAIFNLAVDSPTNIPPVISFSTTPPDGSVCIIPTNILLTATASDNNGISHVNFYDGTNLLASLSTPPYVITTNLAAGDHALFARATDIYESRTWAPPINISILPVVPRLTIQQADVDNVNVTWPLELDGFYIESAPDMNGPWTLSPYPQLYFPNGQTATIPAADQQFFRLMKPR